MSHGSPSPITIAHVVERFSGGVATFVKLLSEAQSNDNRFLTVHLLADLRFAPDSEPVPGVTIHPYESSRKPSKMLRVAHEVGSILEKIRPDIVVAHSSFPGLYTRIIPVVWPVVYCAHGWSFAQSASKTKSWLYALVERALSHRTTAIVNVSAFEQSQALKIGISPAIQQIIMNGVPEAGPQKPLRFSVDQSCINFGFIGRPDPKKGIDQLLQIFQDSRLRNTRLWIIGGHRGDLDNPAPNSHNVQFVGWIPNSEIDSHIKQLDAVIIPSRWEAFSLVAAESMRAGRAIVATRAGGLQELVFEGKNGLFIDISNAEAARTILGSLTKEQLQIYGDYGSKFFKTELTWRKCYETWTRLIARVVSNSQEKDSKAT